MVSKNLLFSKITLNKKLTQLMKLFKKNKFLKFLSLNLMIASKTEDQWVPKKSVQKDEWMKHTRLIVARLRVT